MRLARGVAVAAVLLWPAIAEAQARTAIDDAGTAVALRMPARRVVSLAPNATEIIYAAGAGGTLVGTAASSDYPPEARKVPRVGDASSLDLENIVALAPDLVVTWPYTVPAQLAVLRRRGVAIFMVDPRTVEDIARDIERIGVLAGTEEVARPAAEAIRARDRGLRERYRARPPITVFYQVWDTPLVTLGGTHLVSRALESCGGRNVFAAASVPAPNVTVEAVVAARPEAIVAGGDAGRQPAWLERWQRWPSVPAVAYGNLFAVNADHLHRSGPRFVEGVAELCEALEAARARRARYLALHSR